MKNDNQNRLRRLLPIMLFGLLAVLLLFPSWKTGYVIGATESDVWPHLWGYWWIGDSVINNHEIPFETGLIKHPQGGVLYFPDLFGALLSVPFQLFLSIEQAFNCVLAIKVFLLGLSSFLLCKHVTGGQAASVVAGIFMATSPFFLSEIHNGISEVLNFSWTVLFILALLKLGSGQRHASITAAVCFFITFLGNWYYALINVMCAVLWFGSLLIKDRKRSLSVLPYALIAGVLSAGLVLPLAGVLARSLKADTAIVKRDHTEVLSLFKNEHNVVDVLSFVMPGSYHSPDLKKKFGENFYHVSYIGFVLIVSAVFGWLSSRRRAGPFWLLLVIFFFIMTLGPFLYVKGRFVTMGGSPLKLPFYYVFKYVPFFSTVGHPQRFFPVLGLALMVYASFGWTHLLKKIRYPALTAIFIGTLLVLENLFLSPAPYPIDVGNLAVDPFMTKLGSNYRSEAVIDLPVKYKPYWLNTRYFYYQMYHRRNTTYTVNSPCTTLKTTMSVNPFVKCLLSIEFNERYSTSWAAEKNVVKGVKDLVGEGFAYVFVYHDFYTDKRARQRTYDFLERSLGQPVHASDMLKVFKLAPESSRSSPQGGDNTE